MTKSIPTPSKKLESFCKDFLTQRGYVVIPYFDYFPGKPITEQDILSRFYFLNSKARGTASTNALKNIKADTLIIRKVLHKITQSGISYENALQFLSEMIEFLFENLSRFGGPYLSFRIFSSDEFLESLVFNFEKEKEEREDNHWLRDCEELSTTRTIDNASVLEKLRKIASSQEQKPTTNRGNT